MFPSFNYDVLNFYFFLSLSFSNFAVHIILLTQFILRFSSSMNVSTINCYSFSFYAFQTFKFKRVNDFKLFMTKISCLKQEEVTYWMIIEIYWDLKNYLHKCHMMTKKCPVRTNMKPTTFVKSRVFSRWCAKLDQIGFVSVVLVDFLRMINSILRQFGSLSWTKSRGSQKPDCIAPWRNFKRI